MTVNRLCASGLEAIAQAARSIKTGDGDILLAGGVESMTRSPFVMLKPDRAFPRNARELVDTTIGWRFVNPRMEENYSTESMGETAENVAEKLRRLARGPGRVRARVAPAGDRGPGGREVRRGDRHRRRAAAEGPAGDRPLRRGAARRTRRSRSSRSCARRSARAAPSPPATRRRSTTAPPASCSPPTRA